MEHHHHNHLHRRQTDTWEDFVDGWNDIADELSPLRENKPIGVPRSPAPEVVFQTVYTTLPQTFDGPVAGWSTVGQSDDTPATNPPATNAAATAAVPASTQAAPSNSGGRGSGSRPSDDSAEQPPASTGTRGANLSTLPDSVVPTGTSNIKDLSSLVQATSNPATTTGAAQTNAIGGAVRTTGGSTATPSATAAADSSDSETSAGTKAGIAFGVLGGLLLLGLLAYFFINKRKKQKEQESVQDDEKMHGPGPVVAAGRPLSFNSARSVQTTATSATAPQLQLRPVTQFMPNFGERRSSKGAQLALTVPGGGQTSRQPEGPPASGGNSLWERPLPANPPVDPFGDHAERAHTPTAAEQANKQVQNPFDAPENVVGMAQTTNSPPRSSPIGANVAGGAAAAGAAVVAGAAAGAVLGRKSSVKEAPAPLDLTRDAMPIPAPPSPAPTEFSQTSVAPGQSPGPSQSAEAIAAAGGPSSSVVHRVQLDFQPSMEDEMELKAGQLVRLLHEYDDGWALCIRLDRSEQGVVPRTCLSTRPVKPRPNGGPRNGPPVNPSGHRGPPRGPPGARPMTPQGRPMTPQGRPMTPQGRPMTPQGGPPHPRPESPMRAMPPGGRPQSPAHGRPMNGGRPSSPAGGRPMSPGMRAQSPGPRQQRPQSPSGMNRRMSPPGPSPMNPQQGRGPPGRKPVPGQAY
jgi:hypothetical protein